MFVAFAISWTVVSTVCIGMAPGFGGNGTGAVTYYRYISGSMISAEYPSGLNNVSNVEVFSVNQRSIMLSVWKDG